MYMHVHVQTHMQPEYTRARAYTHVHTHTCTQTNLSLRPCMKIDFPIVSASLPQIIADIHICAAHIHVKCGCKHASLQQMKTDTTHFILRDSTAELSQASRTSPTKVPIHRAARCACARVRDVCTRVSNVACLRVLQPLLHAA